ncbi:seryl-tRNA synthetase domain protein [Chlamydia psittaci 01DC11]|nr:seryl-tRNA synthetase domain protein [Chlamydia psittaci 01DC11]
MNKNIEKLALFQFVEIFKQDVQKLDIEMQMEKLNMHTL